MQSINKKTGRLVGESLGLKRLPLVKDATKEAILKSFDDMLPFSFMLTTDTKLIGYKGEAKPCCAFGGATMIPVQPQSLASEVTFEVAGVFELTVRGNFTIQYVLNKKVDYLLNSRCRPGAKSNETVRISVMATLNGKVSCTLGIKSFRKAFGKNKKSVSVKSLPRKAGEPDTLNAPKKGDVKAEGLFDAKLELEFNADEVVKSYQFIHTCNKLRFAFAIGDLPKGKGGGAKDGKIKVSRIEGIHRTLQKNLGEKGVTFMSELAAFNPEEKVKGISRERMKSYFIPAAKLFTRFESEILNEAINEEDIEVLVKVYNADVEQAVQDSLAQLKSKIKKKRVQLPAEYTPDTLFAFLQKMV